jgi:hypothetical protein
MVREKQVFSLENIHLPMRQRSYNFPNSMKHGPAPYRNTKEHFRRTPFIYCDPHLLNDICYSSSASEEFTYHS